jgi:hypothetical protein
MQRGSHSLSCPGCFKAPRTQQKFLPADCVEDTTSFKQYVKITVCHQVKVLRLLHHYQQHQSRPDCSIQASKHRQLYIDVFPPSLLRERERGSSDLLSVRFLVQKVHKVVLGRYKQSPLVAI